MVAKSDIRKHNRTNHNKVQTKVNGCGACNGWLSWIKPPHYKFFYTNCVLHDELYNLGGTEKDRLNADIRLYKDMIKHSISYFDDNVSAQTWFIILSYLYYLAVRLFGKSQFNYTNDRNTKQNN